MATVPSLNCACSDFELAAAIELREGAEKAAREYRAEAETLRADAEALARAVSASLMHGEQSPLADSLSEYLSKHPWSDL